MSRSRVLALSLATLALGCDPGPQAQPATSDTAAVQQPHTPAPETSPARTKPASGPERAEGPIEQLPAAKVEPAQGSPSADTPPDPPPASPSASRPSEFAAHVQTLLDAAQPTLGPNPGKDAFAHYQAGRHAQALPLFGAAALARPTEWKPAFNMACSASLHGDEQTARIALSEALRRDRSVVRDKAAKDSDLEAMRSKPWFDALLADPPAPAGDASATPPDDDDANTDEEPDDETKAERAYMSSWHGQNCSDLGWDEPDKPRRCWDEFIVGEFEFKALSFDTPLELELPELPDPSAMPVSRWKRISSKVDVRAITKAMGVRGGYGISPDTCESSAALVLEADECPFYRPGFWWPSDGELVVVIPHTERRSPNTVRTVTLAREIGGQWMGTTIDAILEPDHLTSGSYMLHSGPLLRPDGLELWTWAEGRTDDEYRGSISDLYLCRIGWYEGELRKACASDWSTQFTFAHPEVSEMISEY